MMSGNVRDATILIASGCDEDFVGFDDDGRERREGRGWLKIVA